MSDEENSHQQVIGENWKNKVVGELKDYFDNKFGALENSVKADTEWVVEDTRKWARKDSSVSLRNLGNKKQFEFNCDLDDLLLSIDKAVGLRQAAKAKEFIKEARAKIKHRNKLIRIADTSSAGWATVQDYELIDVASDSDDDKRIRRAEERAKSRIEKSKQNDSVFKSANSNFRNSRQANFRGAVDGRSSYQQTASIVCYKCGVSGHFAYSCSARYQPSRPVATPGNPDQTNTGDSKSQL